MAFTSVGDLSLTHVLNARSARAKGDVARFGTEFSTGVRVDTSAAVQHDFSVLASIQRTIDMTQSYQNAATEAGVFTASAQAALTRTQDAVGKLASQVVVENGNQINTLSREAETQLQMIVDTLNQSVAGRTLFGGQNIETPALADVQTMLNALLPQAQAAQSNATWQASLDAWFAPGGGFDTIGYIGANAPIADFVVGENQTVPFTVTASDTGIRTTLKAVMHVALLDRTGFAAHAQEVTHALRDAGALTLGAHGMLADTRARVGMAEAAIAAAQTQNASEKAGLEIMRNDLIAADPFEAATKLEETNRQLESIYLITARIARLNLANYL